MFAARGAKDLELLPQAMCPLHWRMAWAWKRTAGLPYFPPLGLLALWARASTPIEQAVAALAMLASGFFLRFSEVGTIMLAHLAKEKLLGYCSSKVGGFQHLRRPMHSQCAVWGVHLVVVTKPPPPRYPLPPSPLPP